MRAFFNVWVLATLVLYYFGPIDWPGRVDPWVAIFVSSCVLSFNIGYVSLATPQLRRHSDFDLTGLLKNRWFAITVMLSYAVMTLAQMQVITGQSMFSALSAGFSFTTIYADYQQHIQNGVVLGFVGQIVFLVKALIFPVALVLICHYFGRSYLILISFFGPMVLFSLARGTDKETFDLAIILGIISYYYGVSRRGKLIIFFLIGIALYIFVLRKVGRFDDNLPNCLPDSVTCFNFNSYLAKMSPLLEVGFIMGSHYLTQGFEGLNIAFGIDFEFNYGLGHLPPLKSMLCSILDVGCGIKTYSDGLALAGWDTRYRWSTAYTALANDFGWICVPAYTFFLGWSLRLAEVDWQSRRSSSGLAVIVLIGVFTFYSSATMQLSISLDWTLATVFLLYGKALSVRTRVTRLR